PPCHRASYHGGHHVADGVVLKVGSSPCTNNGLGQNITRPSLDHIAHQSLPEGGISYPKAKPRERFYAIPCRKVGANAKATADHKPCGKLRGVHCVRKQRGAKLPGARENVAWAFANAPLQLSSFLL